MPRSHKTWALVAAAGGCAALPPPILHAALAATAGTLFEAAPFVLAMALIRGPWTRRAAALFGCGCGSTAGPAALSLPGTALCWLAFGPAVAIGRFAVALAFGVRRGPGDTGGDDPLAELAGIGAPAFVLGIVTALLQSGAAASIAVPAPALPCLEGIAGLGLGALAPCSTAAVALAAMLRGPAPFAAAGVLATAGVLPPFFRKRQGVDRPMPLRSARTGLALLGAACFSLALHGGAGFVHPRLVPLVWLGAVAALFAVRRGPLTRLRTGWVVPAGLFVALALGSPVPAAQSATESLDDVYPGESIVFAGRASVRSGATVLVRYAITCCRADASAVVLPTDRRLPVATDSWVEAAGTIAVGQAGAYLRVRSWRSVPAPQDPYFYR